MTPRAHVFVQNNFIDSSTSQARDGGKKESVFLRVSQEKLFESKLESKSLIVAGVNLQAINSTEHEAIIERDGEGIS